eukprot:2548008-Prymnesium_polylepis.1
MPMWLGECCYANLNPPPIRDPSPSRSIARAPMCSRAAPLGFHCRTHVQPRGTSRVPLPHPCAAARCLYGSIARVPMCSRAVPLGFHCRTHVQPRGASRVPLPHPCAAARCL